MAAPARAVMNDLAALADALRSDERFEEATNVVALIEAANAAGHTDPSPQVGFSPSPVCGDDSVLDLIENVIEERPR